MTDIVERLRDKWKHSEDDCYEAADEIERLRAGRTAAYLACEIAFKALAEARNETEPRYD